MFRMGGPIKEGVMHGIREPYRGGQIVGLGSKIFKNISKLFGKTNTIRPTPIKKVPITGTTPSSLHKGYPGNIGGDTSVKAGEEITKKVWTPHGWVARDPTYQIGKKVVEGSGWIGKPLKWAGQTLATPTGAIGLT